MQPSRAGMQRRENVGASHPKPVTSGILTAAVVVDSYFGKKEKAKHSINCEHAHHAVMLHSWINVDAQKVTSTVNIKVRVYDNSSQPIIIYRFVAKKCHVWFLRYRDAAAHLLELQKPQQAAHCEYSRAHRGLELRSTFAKMSAWLACLVCGKVVESTIQPSNTLENSSSMYIQCTSCTSQFHPISRLLPYARIFTSNHKESPNDLGQVPFTESAAFTPASASLACRTKN